MSRPVLGLIALILLAVSLVAYTTHLRPHTPISSPGTESEVKGNDAAQKQGPPPVKFSDPAKIAVFDKYKTGAIQATLEIEGRGLLVLELYPKAAPKTVAHFVELCKSHFYDGMLFHRVEPNFVAQTGDPKSKNYKPEQLRGLSSEEVAKSFSLGGGGSGASIPLEANLPHVLNSIGLARSTDLNSGDSQFYINSSDNTETLDGKYCVFGRVIGGMDLIAQIKIGDRIKRLSIP